MGHEMKLGRKGYTLVELLAVSVLALTLLTVAVAGFRTWVTPATADRAVSDFEAELTRLRAYSLSRGCHTRLRAIEDAQGDLIVAERMDVGDEGLSRSWRIISPTGCLERTAISPRQVFFRPDGSCATNMDALFEDAEFSSYTFSLIGRKAGSEDPVVNDQIVISARSGLTGRKESR